jgi:hypothetical protein
MVWGNVNRGVIGVEGGNKVFSLRVFPGFRGQKHELSVLPLHVGLGLGLGSDLRARVLQSFLKLRFTLL